MWKRLICTLLNILFVKLNFAQTFFNKNKRNVQNNCLQNPFIKTRLITECVLECQRKELNPIHKEDECFCVAKECLAEEQEAYTTETNVALQQEAIGMLIMCIYHFLYNLNYKLFQRLN